MGNPPLELLGFLFATAEDLGVKAGFSDEDASFERRIISSQVYMLVFVKYLLDVLGVGAEDDTHVRPEEHRLSLMDRGVEFHAFLVLEDHSSSGVLGGCGADGNTHQSNWWTWLPGLILSLCAFQI